MEIKKEDLLEQVVIALRDEFNATVNLENGKIFLCFSNNQKFCLELS